VREKKRRKKDGRWKMEDGRWKMEADMTKEEERGEQS